VFVEPRLEVATEAHIREVRAQARREVAWYRGEERFKDIDHVLGAVAAQKLVRVSADSNTMPILRLRTPGMERHKPPFLLPTSRVALAAVGRLWREELVELGITAPELRLSVTSLVRPEDTQDALVRSGAIAAPDSTHCVGATFDIDISGYYRVDLDTGIVPVVSPLRNRAAMQDIGEQLGQRYGHSGPQAVADPSEFDGRVVTALMVTVQELHEGDYVNRIVEHPGTGNQCLHVCPNPAVPAAEWRSMADDANNATWMG
jgi:hypothetical protein